MKVRDLLTIDIDIDVYDDYDERLGIAFCSGYTLTSIGEKVFEKALDLPISSIRNDVCIIHCETGKEASMARDFFESIAGYCSSSDFDKWFMEVK